MDTWEKLEYVAEALVTIGVIGEVFAEWRDTENKLAKVFSLILIIGLVLSLAALEKTNEGFNGKVADLNLQASRATERAANIEAENVRLGTALAVQQGKAAQAELALLKLQQRLAWRHISPEEYKRAKRELLPFKGSYVIVGAQMVLGSDKEPDAFAKQIAKLFRDSGWKVKLTSITEGGFMPQGIWCAANRTAAGNAAEKFCERLPSVVDKSRFDEKEQPYSAQVLIRPRAGP